MSPVLLQALRRWFNYQWHGPSDLPRSLMLEWRFVNVRWMAIIPLMPGLLLANLPLDRLLAVYAVLGVAAIYNVTVQLVMPRKPHVFALGYPTMLGDALLNVAMVSVGGGFDSPFYYILFTVTISGAMRYGYAPSSGVVLLYVLSDFIGRLVSHNQSFDAPIIIRSVFLLITTLLAGYLREQMRQAEAALQERLRQSNALNEATATLGASLELEAVLRAATAAAAQLVGSSLAVLRPSASLNGDATSAPLPVYYPDEPSPAHRDLEQLCQRHERRYQRGTDELICLERLPFGQQAIVLILALAPRQTALATLAVAVPSDVSLSLDSDILDAFVERITLAIENASLYRTLADRSTDLQRAYADLATAHQELLGVDEMKTNFLANVSHELRTPLTSIRSFSELLLTYEDDTDVQREFLHIINAESERLTRLVNDVLDITKIEAGHMDWQMATINVPELLQDAARTFGPLIAQGNLSFELDIDDNLPPVHGDRDRLQQVIANLLNNAVKFTHHGSISLRAEVWGDEVRIAVTDTGIGIAPEDQGRIFEKFQQVGDTLTDKPRGTGLGLAICRDIVEYHQGRLWVDSQPGAGSCFTVALPILSEPLAVEAA